MFTEIVACASIGYSYGKLGEPVPVDETAIYIKKTTIEEILIQPYVYRILQSLFQKINKQKKLVRHLLKGL